ncbi:MAG: glycosyltransferase [Acetobacteraceae bacterium]
MTAALLAAAILLLLMAAHPFGTYPLSLAALARLRPRPILPGPPPATAALCVCAYNEERVIREKAENMIAMRHALPGLELLIYVDAATDRTADILRDYAGAIQLVVSPVRTGKTHGMNTLVARTAAECVVFSDANVTFAANAMPALLAPFGDPSVGLTCGHLRYSRHDDNATARTGSWYWQLEERIKQLESASGSVMGADGSIFAVRRTLYRPAPPDLIDDMFVSLMVLCEGHRLVRAGNALAYEESVTRPKEEFRRKVRIACQAFNVHRVLRPRLRRLPLLDRYKYVSHKLLRWLTVYLLAGSFACLVAALALAQRPALLAGLLAIACIGAIWILRATHGPGATLRSILAAFLATGIGCWRSLRGDRFQTWSPPASTRSTAEATPAGLAH